MNYDPDRAACVLADAIVLGDRVAARKWQMSTRTVERYRARMSADKELAAAVREKNASIEQDLSVMRIAFLRKALAEMEAKLPDATLFEVAGAVKIVGELHQVAMAVDDDRPDSPDTDAAEAQSGIYGQTLVEH